jgi:hypothetical protein
LRVVVAAWNAATFVEPFHHSRRGSDNLACRKNCCSKMHVACRSGDCLPWISDWWKESEYNRSPLGGGLISASYCTSRSVC